MSTIIQIIPAQPGWVAAFVDGDLEHGFSTEPIACWALTEAEGAQRVVALMSFGDEALDEVAEGQGLIGYFPSEAAAQAARKRRLQIAELR